VETVLSGPALERFYASRAGESLPLQEIVERSKTGEENAITTVERLCSGFGKAASTVVNIVDPHVIVIGGGVGNVDELYTLGRKSLDSYVFNNRLGTVLSRPQLGDSAGVFGAALLCA
jgi:predicted NBD/HSP70 family sugar kinase